MSCHWDEFLNKAWFLKYNCLHIIIGVSGVSFSDHPRRFFTIFWGTPQWFFPINTMQKTARQTTRSDFRIILRPPHAPDTPPPTFQMEWPLTDCPSCHVFLSFFSWQVLQKMQLQERKKKDSIPEILMPSGYREIYANILMIQWLPSLRLERS